MLKRCSLKLIILIILSGLTLSCAAPLKPFESSVTIATPFVSPLAWPSLPTPLSPTVATVGGRLLRNSNGVIQPMAGVKIILAPVIRSADGTPIVASVNNNEETKLTTITDENGQFVFIECLQTHIA